MATFAFIKAGDFRWTSRLSERLLCDPLDLVHRAFAESTYLDRDDATGTPLAPRLRC